ncbi:MAG: glycosylase [Cyclobacteriaceae bacterium]|nr:glycosylase [Cyclobacteriaceae bacterium]
MKKGSERFLYAAFVLAMGGCGTGHVERGEKTPFPAELVEFNVYEHNPVFTGTGKEADWDENIRERGFILREDSLYHMWYTGFQSGPDKTLFLGYATSVDGIDWERFQDNPVFSESWTEDMMVWKEGQVYYMFAEGRNDIAHLLTSSDRITWKDHGSLDIRKVDGSPLEEGPYGTPTVWVENGVWYLFYERNDLGIWLATSTDLAVWKNVQDEPVILMGPEQYDQYGLAVNQIIKHKGWYYAYYHGTAFEDWHEWSTNVAASPDLVHWEKFSGNPLMGENKSSGIVVHDGKNFRLYTMHDEVAVHFPK